MNSTNSTFDFAQKVALIAGGTGGLGSALATELRSRGCIVTTVSRTPNTDPNHIAADLRSPEAATAVAVAQRIIAAIANGETDLPSTAFSN